MQRLTADDLLLLLLLFVFFSKIFKLRVVEESSGLERIGCSKGTWLSAVWIGKTLLCTETGWSREKIGGLL
jgi:hypothetical protein